MLYLFRYWSGRIEMSSNSWLKRIEKINANLVKRRQSHYKKVIFRLPCSANFQKERDSAWWAMLCQLRNLMSNIPIRNLFKIKCSLCREGEKTWCHVQALLWTFTATRLNPDRCSEKTCENREAKRQKSNISPASINCLCLRICWSLLGHISSASWWQCHPCGLSDLLSLQLWPWVSQIVTLLKLTPYSRFCTGKADPCVFAGCYIPVFTLVLLWRTFLSQQWSSPWMLLS